MCPVMLEADEGGCSGGEPLKSVDQFHTFPYGHLKLAGDFGLFGGADSFRTTYPHCQTANGQSVNDCDSGPHSSLYFRKVDGPVSEIDPANGLPFGYSFYDYWAFYRVNDFRPLVGFHVGDWEAVSVALNRHSATHSTFDYVTFSQHGTYYAYLRDNLACQDAPSPGGPPGPTTCGSASKRVVSMVAAGTHANYARPCSTGDFGECHRDHFPDDVLQENGYNGRYEWGNAFDQTALREMPAIWGDWEGHWGQTNGGTASPPSPGRQSLSDIRCAQNLNDAWDLFPCDYFAPHPKRHAAPKRTKKRPRSRFVPVKLSRAQPPTASGPGRYHSPGEAAAFCAAWAGNGVSATVCDPKQLTRAAREGTLGELGRTSLKLTGSTETAASAPGVTQLMGPVVANGDRLTVRGPLASTSVLSVRVHGPARAQALVQFRVKDILSRKARRGGRHQLRIGVRHTRGGKPVVRINGHAPAHVIAQPQKKKHKRKKHRRHRKHP